MERDGTLARLAKENSDLRVAANQFFSDVCEWRDIAEELAEALRLRMSHTYVWKNQPTIDAALARYDRAAR